MPMDIYAEELISHYEHPHNKRKIPGASAEFHDDNPTCGDELTMYIKVKDGKIEDISFEGYGCAISQASASMLTDFIKGKGIEDAKKMDYEKLKELIGIDPGPGRMNCAVLCLKTLAGALFVYEQRGDSMGQKPSSR